MRDVNRARDELFRAIGSAEGQGRLTSAGRRPGRCPQSPRGHSPQANVEMKLADMAKGRRPWDLRTHSSHVLLENERLDGVSTIKVRKPMLRAWGGRA